MSSPALDSLLAAQAGWVTGNDPGLTARRAAGLKQLRLNTGD